MSVIIFLESVKYHLPFALSHRKLIIFFVVWVIKRALSIALRVLIAVVVWMHVAWILAKQVAIILSIVIVAHFVLAIEGVHFVIFPYVVLVIVRFWIIFFSITAILGIPFVLEPICSPHEWIGGLWRLITLNAIAGWSHLFIYLVIIAAFTRLRVQILHVVRVIANISK